jgi:hypothetical protein
MSGEINCSDQTGLIKKAVIKNRLGQWVNGTSLESFNPAHVASYGVPVAELSNGQYQGNFPAVPADLYSVEIFNCVGTSLSLNDIANIPAQIGIMNWNGTQEVFQTGDNYSRIGANGVGLTSVALASTGLNSILTTAPTGPATNFAQMVVQIWRRFFKKVTMSSTQLQTFADNGTTVLTTQPLSVAGSTQTQGAAS